MPAAPKTSRTAARYAAGWRSRMPTSSSRPPASTWPRITRAISRTSRSSPGAATISIGRGAGRSAASASGDSARPVAARPQASRRRASSGFSSTNPNARTAAAPAAPGRPTIEARGLGEQVRGVVVAVPRDRRLQRPVHAASSRTFALSGNVAASLRGPEPGALDVEEGPQHGRREVPRVDHPGEVAARGRHRLADRPVDEEPVGHRRERLPSRAREGQEGDALGQLGKRHDVDPGDAVERARQTGSQPRAEKPARHDEEDRAARVLRAQARTSAISRSSSRLTEILSRRARKPGHSATPSPSRVREGPLAPRSPSGSRTLGRPGSTGRPSTWRAPPGTLGFLGSVIVLAFPRAERQARP